MAFSILITVLHYSFDSAHLSLRYCITGVMRKVQFNLQCGLTGKFTEMFSVARPFLKFAVENAYFSYTCFDFIKP